MKAKLVNPTAPTPNSTTQDDISSHTTAYINPTSSSAIPLLKLRPILKNDEEKEEEKQLIFLLPRKNCQQISPELFRFYQQIQHKTLPGKLQQHRWHIYQRLLRQARHSKEEIDKNILPYLKDFDASDRVICHGEVSKRLYQNIFHSRNINLYGNLQRTVKYPLRKYLELKALASEYQIEYTQEMDEKDYADSLSLIEKENLEKVKEFDKWNAKKLPKVRTDRWNIPNVPIYYPPVGFAANPSQQYHSFGKEFYFSYDGNWSYGKLEGKGRYVYSDDSNYEGDFHANRPEGKGRSQYMTGHLYEGNYQNGSFHGEGKYSSPEGIKYEGEYFNGQRDGKGKLTFPSGLAYEGDFLRGKPHGRGIMTSKLTGWSFEGEFREGGVSGHGVLIRPQNKERIPYYWDEKKDPISFQALINHHLRTVVEERAEKERKENEINAPLRGLMLRDYVNKIRTATHNGRRKEKLQKIHETVTKVKEQKAQLYEARMKILAGDGEN